MKNIILLLLLCIAVNATGQIAFYDAVKLKRLGIGGFIPGTNTIQLKQNDEVFRILKYYVPIADSSLKAEIGRSFINNPFLQFAGIPNAGNSLSGANILPSSIGGLDVTNIADGLVQFLIKRGKEELNIAFFSQFKNFLDDHEECKILFPKTVDFLGKIETYKYAAFLENLRESFHTDLNNIIIHLNQLIVLPKYDSLIQKHPEIKLVIGTSRIINELSQSGESILPDSVITQLATLPWSGVSKNLGTALNFLNLISQSVREVDTSKNRSWVQLSELNKYLFTDSITLRIYFGLIYQQAKTLNLKFYSNSNKDSIRVDTILARQKNHIFTLSGLVENFSLLATDVEKSINDIRTKKIHGTITNEDYYTYINKAIDIIDYGFTLTTTFKIDHSKFDIIHDKYLNVARNSNDLFKNIYTKNYGSAVTNLCSIIDSISDLDTDNKLLSGILKYGTFMASVVKSETPGEVASAIEAAALPSGSSSIKKNSLFNISLNSYIGGSYSNYTNSTDKIDGSNSKVGVTAPVGIAFSWGLGHYNTKKGTNVARGALSAYLTIIDVGAIAGYRLTNDSTGLEQKVTIDDIFTPGGYLVYGLGGLPFLEYIPLSIGYGFQYGSKLYYKTSTGSLETSEKSRWRGNFFIGIDIPLANLWTKNYNKKE